MRREIRLLSPEDAAELERFLCSPERPEGTFSFHELQGFLFAVASSPESISPSEWLPMISNDESIGFRNEREAQTILNHVMALYNEVNTAVLERSRALPSGIAFDDDIAANFKSDAPVSLWSRGFTAGYDWLVDVWEEHMLEEMDEECGAILMILSFFGSRQLAEAFYTEVGPDRRKGGESSFEEFAEAMRATFPDALASHAHLGRTFFEVISEHGPDKREPAKSVRIGRNEPCPCGSGKKYKQCCSGQLH